MDYIRLAIYCSIRCVLATIRKKRKLHPVIITVHYMLDKSKGLKNLALIDESKVRLYVYLILTSQISSRSNINSFEAKKLYMDNFENAINRSISTQQDIARYQQIITQAEAKSIFP